MKGKLLSLLHVKQRILWEVKIVALTCTHFHVSWFWYKPSNAKSTESFLIVLNVLFKDTAKLWAML